MSYGLQSKLGEQGQNICYSFPFKFFSLPYLSNPHLYPSHSAVTSLHKSFCGQRALKKLPLSYVLTKQLILRCNLRWQLDKYIYIYRVAKKSWPTCDKVHVWPIYFGPEEICIFKIFNLELIFSFQFCR